MNAQRAAGWVAVISGALLAVGLVGSAVASAAGVPGTSGWTAMMGGGGTGTMMGNGMMGNGMMGSGTMPHRMMPGMMGFGTSGPASTPIPNAPEVNVTATNFALTPKEIRLPRNADVNLTLLNGTGVVHDLTVPALGVHVVANPGETKTVGLRGLAAGRYDAYCSVPGHADLGMRATVIVQ